MFQRLPVHLASGKCVGKIIRIEEEEEVFITSGNWGGKDKSLSRYGGADQS